SMSLSSPFFTPSMQSCAQTPFLHDLLVQSLSTRHIKGSAQRGHFGPPQSLSVSSPFFTPSLQVGAAHFLSLPHLPLPQSPSPPQPFPSAHFSVQGPPQSTSVSNSF